VGGALRLTALDIFVGFEMRSSGPCRFLFAAGFAVTDLEVAGFEIGDFEA
jgi:hypothetical protein